MMPSNLVASCSCWLAVMQTRCGKLKGRGPARLVGIMFFGVSGNQTSELNDGASHGGDARIIAQGAGGVQRLEYREKTPAWFTVARVGQGPRPLLFQPTTQPTISVVLYDLRGVWQSPRACKLL